MTISADFKPILSAYVACGYKENEVLRSEIVSQKPIWQGDLLALGDSVTIVIKKGNMGEYQATMVNGNFADEDDEDVEVDDGTAQEVAMWKGVDAELWGRKVEICLSFLHAEPR